MDGTIVGIDLGTTNSEVAFYEDGKVTVIEAGDSKLVPSYVGIDDNDKLLVGAAARNQYALSPERTVKSIKRLMGTQEQVPLGGKQYLPQEISAIILRNLKQMAEAYLGHEVIRAVITVPAYFSDQQRQATRQAAEIAGLRVVKMINEPTAATLVYESREIGSKKVLVYDLGGGTFDVSLVEFQDDVIEVVASHGDNQLGGDDFDELIEQWLLRHLQEQEIDTREITGQVKARLKRAAEKAKKELSRHPFATIEEEFLLEHEGAPFHLNLELARHEYEEMIRPLFDKTLDAVHLVLADSGVTAREVDEILLVGGSTRTPLIKDRLAQEFGRTPRGDIDPDLSVAMGAAIQAAMASGREVRAILVDITPYTFGVGALGYIEADYTPYRYVPIITKNTAVPVTMSEVFYTNHDNQEKVEIRVYQGENLDVRENLRVGCFFVEGLGEFPAGSEIIATFSLDVNGILEVTATEKATGLQKSVIIENVLATDDTVSLGEARQKIQQLFADDYEAGSDTKRPERRAGRAENTNTISRQRKVQAEALVEKGVALSADACDEDSEDILALTETIEEALAADNVSQLEAAMEELSEILFFLET